MHGQCSAGIDNTPLIDILKYSTLCSGTFIIDITVLPGTLCTAVLAWSTRVPVVSIHYRYMNIVVLLIRIGYLQSYPDNVSIYHDIDNNF